MKVYAIIHYYDNGLSYEDYREYENHYLYSSLDCARVFWNKATSDYEGRYTLVEWELNTQKQIVLEETPYIACLSEWAEEELDR